MAETTDQIRNEIEHQRQELGENLQQLETKVKSTVDWRAQFEERPMAGIGLAFGVGFGLAMLMGGGDSSKKQEERRYTSNYRVYDESSATPYQASYQPLSGESSTSSRERPRSSSRPSPEMREVNETLENIRGAVMGMAAERLRSFLAESVPGFKEEYEQARRSRGASEATKISADGPSHSSDHQHSQAQRSEQHDTQTAATATSTSMGGSHHPGEMTTDRGTAGASTYRA